LELAQTIPKTLILLTKKIKQELLKLLDNSSTIRKDTVSERQDDTNNKLLEEN
jgi:hypothetical protein